jgi:hypothetical protein
MDGLLEVLKQKAQLVANVAGLKSHSVKLRADIAFLERDIKNRQHTFGVQLYDHVAVWSAKPEFFAANDDNILIATLRPPLIMAQREIAALHLKRTSLKERINVASSSRTASFNQTSDHWTETIQNAGRTTLFAGNEAKLKTELSFVEREISSYKHTFGVTIFQQFSLLEDTKGWLPTDREIRTFYDACRKDIDSYRKKIELKEQEIANLDSKEKGIWNSNGSNASGESDIINSYDAPLSQNASQHTLGYKAKSHSGSGNGNGQLTMSTGIIDDPTNRFAQQQQQQQLHGWYGGQQVGFPPTQQQEQTFQPDYFSPATQPNINPTPASAPYMSDNGLFRYGTNPNDGTTPGQQPQYSGGFDGL